MKLMVKVLRFSRNTVKKKFVVLSAVLTKKCYP
jgi:hypothetical protein